MQQAEQMGPAVTVTWLGAAGTAIAVGGRCVLVDPYFSRLPLRRLAVGTPLPDEARIAAALERLPEIAAVIVGHTHIDHALDVPALARRTAAPVFGSRDLDALLSRAGLPRCAAICEPGDTHELPGLGSFTVLRGAHGGVLLGRPPLPGTLTPDGPYPLRAREYRCGAVLVFDLHIGGCRVVHVGSAGVAEGPGLAGACDLLLLCVPGWKALPDYPGAYLRKLRPRAIVPIHFDRLGRPLDDPRALQPDPLTARLNDLPGFLNRIRALAPDIPVRLPGLQEPFACSRPPKT